MSQVRAITRELEEFTERLMVRLALNVSANLKETTPVLTGWARANWLAAINEDGVETPDNPDPTPQDASSRAAEQSSREASVASTYSLERGPISISNGVPYIRDLNDGSSQKAPAGFVQGSIAKGVLETRRGRG